MRLIIFVLCVGTSFPVCGMAPASICELLGDHAQGKYAGKEVIVQGLLSNLEEDAYFPPDKLIELDLSGQRCVVGIVFPQPANEGPGFRDVRNFNLQSVKKAFDTLQKSTYQARYQVQVRGILHFTAEGSNRGRDFIFPVRIIVRSMKVVPQGSRRK